jgi:hypothetical protein
MNRLFEMSALRAGDLPFDEMLLKYIRRNPTTILFFPLLQYIQMSQLPK